MAGPGWSRLSRFTIPDKHNYILQLVTQAHTWSNLELLESGPGRRPLPLEGDKESDSEGEDEQGEVGEQVVPSIHCQINWIGDFWSIL